ncbi:MAG: hypothetical protein ICV64_08435 [Thermoleophilia bacterium]|nr:hypothetical protein [Thermoleophilia bacterium]
MLEWALIVAAYLGVALAFRWLGGISAAGSAIADWGRRSSERRRAAVERRLRGRASSGARATGGSRA